MNELKDTIELMNSSDYKIGSKLSIISSKLDIPNFMPCL
jgi:hypothetical protein